MSEKQIRTMQDIANLTPEELERFLPDLIVWHKVAGELSQFGFSVPGMQWKDDGRPGIVTHVDVIIGDKTSRFSLESGK